MTSSSLLDSAPLATQVDEYRLVRPLGDRDDVFLAHDRRLDRAVVLRFLSRDAAIDAPLLQGARALARVSHPSLCPVYRIREAGDRPCVVQGFERGEKLDALPSPQPAERVLDIGRALAGALETLHAAGVSHGEIQADRIFVAGAGAPRLIGLRHARVDSSAEALAKDVTALVALLVKIADADLRDSLALLAGTEGTAPAAAELLRALDVLARPSIAQEALTANPYRGLRPFEAKDASLFFGRHAEVAEALGRLRSEPWLLVTAPSGAGKSSLVRAGLAPAIADGALGERTRWTVATVVPGQRPLAALVAALAPIFGREPAGLEAELRRKPPLAEELARQRTDVGLLLFVDQLEETMTLADVGERDAFLEVISCFGALAPGVRMIATLRSDFLDRLSDVGTLGRGLLRATFVLPPMSDDGLKQAITGPARARGFEMEKPEMVDALALEAGTAEGADALPLLSFVLAELWTERDRERRVLPRAALARLGGAAAALARHGDTVLAALATEERRQARRILLALVTGSEMRTRRSRDELIGDRGASAEAALEALIRGRLIVASETYEIAHEALVRTWPRLRGWLDEASSARSIAARVTAAAREWARLGRRAELLWGARQLRDLEGAGALDHAPDEARSFVDASRAAVKRARTRRLALRVGLPVGAALLAAGIAGGIRWSERRQARTFVDARLVEARAAIGQLREVDAKVDVARRDAFARYDAGDTAGGEARWRDALALVRKESDAFAAASAPLGLALARDPLDPAARALSADVAYSWLLASERDHQSDVARDLSARLAQLDDDGSRRARLAAVAHLVVTTAPPGARVLLRVVRVDPDGRRVEDEGRAIDLGRRLDLAPGSYVLDASAPDRYATRFPVLLGRDEDLRVEVPLPSAAAIPSGFVFVPAGASLLGSADVEGVRTVLLAEPEHSVHVDAFLIGAHEVTYAEYLEFLAALPTAERAARRPHATGLDLQPGGDGVPSLTLGATTARRGAPFCRPKRSERRCQDWLRFPVAGVAWDDAKAYATWLANRGLPGARLCAEREWERAARGADGRIYPLGDDLHAGDVNFNATYATDDDLMGADEIGSFPLDRSPFGVEDLAGNIAEWMGGSEGTTHAVRGSYWNNGPFSARAAGRDVHHGGRGDNGGFRVCADAPAVR